MNVVPGTGDIVPEPHWRMLLTDDLEIEAAGEHWRRIAKQKAAEAAAWGFIFVCFALATVLAAVGLVHGS